MDTSIRFSHFPEVGHTEIEALTYTILSAKSSLILPYSRIRLLFIEIVF